MLTSDVGEGHFDDGSNKPSGAATPVDVEVGGKGKRGQGKGKGLSKKAKTARQKLAIIDAEGDMGMGGV
jgi:DNA helicase INO80